LWVGPAMCGSWRDDHDITFESDTERWDDETIAGT
jgi:hypothetical protein